MPFLIRFEGDLSNQDRQALNRPGWLLYENSMGSGAAWGAESPIAEMAKHVVRIDDAPTANDALEDVLRALGRRPDKLEVYGS
jgi:hypothetical protein